MGVSNRDNIVYIVMKIVGIESVGRLLNNNRGRWGSPPRKTSPCHILTGVQDEADKESGAEFGNKKKDDRKEFKETTYIVRESAEERVDYWC